VPSATGADREKRFFIAHGKTIFDVVNARRPFVSVFVDVNVTQVWFISLLLERARIEHLNARFPGAQPLAQRAPFPFDLTSVWIGACSLLESTRASPEGRP
jgi:hypothetical protein